MKKITTISLIFFYSLNGMEQDCMQQEFLQEYNVLSIISLAEYIRSKQKDELDRPESNNTCNYTFRYQPLTSALFFEHDKELLSQDVQSLLNALASHYIQEIKQQLQHYCWITHHVKHHLKETSPDENLSHKWFAARCTILDHMKNCIIIRNKLYAKPVDSFCSSGFSGFLCGIGILSLYLNPATWTASLPLIGCSGCLCLICNDSDCCCEGSQPLPRCTNHHKNRKKQIKLLFTDAINDILYYSSEDDTHDTIADAHKLE